MMRFARLCHRILLPALLAVLLGLAGCQPQQDAGSAGVAGGGIGGTGKGTITGFDGVTVNDVRRFDIAPTTQIFLDGEPVGENELRAVGRGLVAQVDLGPDADTAITSGTAVRIRAGHVVKGPVTGTDPLAVLGQDVIVTARTELPDGLDPALLAVGDAVQLSGYTRGNGTIHATRLEMAPALEQWLLAGTVRNLATSGKFQIGEQPLKVGGATVVGCPDGLAEGDFVRVAALPDPAFSPGALLDTLVEIACTNAALDLPFGLVADALPAGLEGVVTSVLLPAFAVNGQVVGTTADTVYEGGTPEDAVPDAKVEVTGTLDTSSGVLTADLVRFREPRVRIEAHVADEDVVPGESLTILGIPVLATAETEDEDGVIADGNADAQVEVRGYVDADGTVLATRVRVVDTVLSARVRLRGPVATLPGAPLFTVLGLNIDTTGATLRGADGLELSAAEFFSRLRVGSIVRVQDGTYDGVDTISHIEEIRLGN